jgi:uncharacterized membrane protein (DUF2068 family)
MKNDGTVPVILQPKQKVRYLKLIAIFKMTKGLLLLLLGCSLLFLNSRDRWMDGISDWVDTEILLGHGKPISFVLNKVQDALASGKLGATAFLSLFYCVVLFTEGIGVYMQQRWAEFLMIFATAALIPLEIRHVWKRPSLAAFIILAANIFIVWFLYKVLKRNPVPPAPVEKRELIETR